jgi:hypothetical protein
MGLAYEMVAEGLSRQHLDSHGKKFLGDKEISAWTAE